MRLPEGIREMKVEDALRVMGVKVPQQCEHIKSNGEFCGSPALRGRHYCYFHLTHIGRRLRAERSRAHLAGVAREYGLNPEAAEAASEMALELPALEDANSIQIALMQVIDAILHNQLDNKRAGLVLYALQTASSNLNHGADFSQAASAVIAGGYESFEEDYELGDDAPELRVVEEQDAVKEDEYNDEEEETEDEDSEGDDEEAEEVEAEDGTAGEDEESASQASTPVKTSSVPKNDVVEDEKEEDPLGFCPAVDQFLCSIMGPMSRALGGGTVQRAMKEASSQRVWLRGPRTEPRTEPHRAAGEEKEVAA